LSAGLGMGSKCAPRGNGRNICDYEWRGSVLVGWWL